MRILVLGGYGHFGARIARALVASPGVEVVVAGRDGARAASLAAVLGPGAQGVSLDHSGHLMGATLRRLGIGAVVHAAGPFQGQGWRVAREVAAAGAHYIDLADGRRFVCDFPAELDAAFRAAGRFGCSGASSVPALSSAVVDHLSAGWAAIDRIDICIAPAQDAPRGRATREAVLGYCGAPIGVWEGGRWTTRPGWARPEPVRFLRLAPRRGALCDVPDLELFPARYSVRDRVRFLAALELASGQWLFAALAALRRGGLLSDPSRLARLVEAVGRRFDRFGTDTGGMVVRVAGVDAEGRPRRVAWHLTAGGSHGPEIPCMAAILLARKLASGEPLPIGAHACMGFLALSDFAPEFARWDMAADIVDESDT